MINYKSKFFRLKIWQKDKKGFTNKKYLPGEADKILKKRWSKIQG
jgi:hypothetical protein